MSKSEPLSLILIYGENGSFQKWFYLESFQNWLDMVKEAKKSCFKNGNGFIGFIVFGRSTFSLADKYFLAVLKLQVRTYVIQRNKSPLNT